MRIKLEHDGWKKILEMSQIYDYKSKDYKPTIALMFRPPMSAWFVPGDDPKKATMKIVNVTFAFTGRLDVHGIPIYHWDEGGSE